MSSQLFTWRKEQKRQFDRRDSFRCILPLTRMFPKMQPPIGTERVYKGCFDILSRHLKIKPMMICLWSQNLSWWLTSRLIVPVGEGACMLWKPRLGRLGGREAQRGGGGEKVLPPQLDGPVGGAAQKHTRTERTPFDAVHRTLRGDILIIIV